ncbi:MAG: YoaK family protein [Thiomicrospira sp.]|jgi:uncharacterized membrane protein YoaK (UPF0700 family)|nr:YoaK family protein [Thiomicrospira sp.]
MPINAHPPYKISNLMILGSFMAAMAGYINTILLIEFGFPVSQMTGVMSILSESSVHKHGELALNALMVLSGFIGGAFLSGLLIGDRQHRQDKRFALGMAILSLLLIISALLAILIHPLTLLSTAIACGLQNALIANYRGLQMRTTHVTGIVTDIGVYLAKLVRHQTWPWQAWLLLLIVLSFFSGGLVGIYAFEWLAGASLLIPAVACLPLALAWLKLETTT